MIGLSWRSMGQDGIIVIPSSCHIICAYLLPPPYSPELNPVKNLWDELREKSFHNRVFGSLDALENHLEVAQCA
jgi:transposase